jgi:hypothetical protein
MRVINIFVIISESKDNAENSSCIANELKIYITHVSNNFKWTYFLTFSGNQGVTNGIWNVLLYECNVSNESGETAPIMANTPRENWLQTNRTYEKKIKYSLKLRAINIQMKQNSSIN